MKNTKLIVAAALLTAMGCGTAMAASLPTTAAAPSMITAQNEAFAGGEAAARLDHKMPTQSQFSNFYYNDLWSSIPTQFKANYPDNQATRAQATQVLYALYVDGAHVALNTMAK